MVNGKFLYKDNRLKRYKLMILGIFFKKIVKVGVGVF